MLLLLACTTTPPATEPPVEADSDADSDTGPVQISPDDPALHYTGRIGLTEAGASLYWPGSAVMFQTDAPSVQARLYDPTGGNYLAVVVDGGDPVVIGGVKGESLVTLAEGLSEDPHQIELHTRTEGWEEALLFTGLLLPEGGSIAAVEAPTLRMEFYGDSITSGYSVDCTCDEDDPVYKNHYQTYAAITARSLGAAHHSISLSGVGLTQSWWDGTMLDYYSGLELEDGAWDFSDWPADIVVINLGQNDYWLGAGAELEVAYVDFVERLRLHHKDAAIFVVIGSMDASATNSPIPGYVRGAVATLNQRGDDRVFSYVFPYVAGGHPVAEVHADMADRLTDFIRESLPELQ